MARINAISPDQAGPYIKIAYHVTRRRQGSSSLEGSPAQALAGAGERDPAPGGGVLRPRVAP